MVLLFRNLSLYEEREMSSRKHTAVKTTKENIEKYINTCKTGWLKQIKREGEEYVILTRNGDTRNRDTTDNISDNNSDNNSDNITDNNSDINCISDAACLLVDVPAFQPLTPIQIKQANKLWPTVYKRAEVENSGEWVGDKCIKRNTTHISDQQIEEFRERNKSRRETKKNKSRRETESVGECIKNVLFVEESGKTHEYTHNIPRDTNKTPFDTNGSLSDTNGSLSDTNGSLFDANGSLSDIVDSHILLGAISSISMHNSSGYLCTGMDCIMDTEPCYSCAMALVHGRIRNVIVVERKREGIFSKHKFNYNPHTNHRFTVMYLE